MRQMPAGSSWSEVLCYQRIVSGQGLMQSTLVSPRVYSSRITLVLETAIIY